MKKQWDFRDFAVHKVLSGGSLHAHYLEGSRRGDTFPNALFVFLSDWSWFTTEIERIVGSMATKSTKSTKEGKPAFKGFVNLSLIDVDKAEIKRLASENPAEGFLEGFGVLFLEGYRLNATFDDRSAAYQVSLYCWGEGNPNYCYAISARNPVLEVALWALWYKHFRLCEGVWPVDGDPSTAETFD